jgi:hypothetical protein
MKKTLLSLALSLAAISVYAQPISLSQTGIAAPSSLGGFQGIDLTPCNHTYSAGAAWANQNVDFTHCFTINFDAYFDVVYGTGGDGICVAFGSNFTTSTAPNGWGGYLGYYDAPGSPNAAYANSVAIEIDNFNNCPYTFLHDCPAIGDHTTMAMNADANPVAAVVLTSPTGTTNIKDATFHHYRVEWIPSTMGGPLLKLYVDNVLRNTCIQPFDAALSPFITPSSVPWGFTAGCAYACSQQVVANVTLNDSCGTIPPFEGPCEDKCYWRLTGNNASPTNFIGTLNSEDFRIRTNNTQWLVVDRLGESGVHIAAPTTTFDADAVPMYPGSPSGIRLRNLPAGPGRPLVVDALGYVFVGPANSNPTGPEMMPTQPGSGAELQSQIDELKQQISELKSMLGNKGTTSADNTTKDNTSKGNNLPANAADKLTVTPNPTQGEISVSVNIAKSYMDAKITITDLTGKNVLTSPVIGNYADVKMMIPTTVSSGQVIISLIVDGKLSTSQKVVLLNK